MIIQWFIIILILDCFFTIKHSSWLFMYLHYLALPFASFTWGSIHHISTMWKTPVFARSLWAETRLHKESQKGGSVVAIPSPFGDRKGCNCYTRYEKRVIFMGISWGYPWGILKNWQPQLLVGFVGRARVLACSEKRHMMINYGTMGFEGVQQRNLWEIYGKS